MIQTDFINFLKQTVLPKRVWQGRDTSIGQVDLLVAEAKIKYGVCGIALSAVSRTYSHFKPFPAHIRTTSRFSHNLELPLYTIYPIVARRAWPTGCIGRVRRASKGILHTRASRTISSIKTNNYGEFRQKLGSVKTIGSSLDTSGGQFRQLGRVWTKTGFSLDTCVACLAIIISISLLP